MRRDRPREGKSADAGIHARRHAGDGEGADSARYEDSGAEIVLGNAYHLLLAPGWRWWKRPGGWDRSCAWRGPVLTDSGGFQVFSLSRLVKVTDEGVSFRSHIDGTALFLSPERVVETQERLGSDIMMVLDQCVGNPCARAEAVGAARRTLEWAARSRRSRRDPSRALFAIVQGRSVR